MKKPTLESTLAKCEPTIRHLAGRYCGRGIEFDDLAQDLRMKAVSCFERFDEQRSGDLMKFMNAKLKFFAIDCVRNTLGRDGERRHVCTMSQFSQFESNGKKQQLPELQDRFCERKLEQVDWDDLAEAVGSGIEDQVLFLSACGVTLATIAKQFNTSESNISLIKNKRCEHAKCRIARLLGVE